MKNSNDVDYIYEKLSSLYPNYSNKKPKAKIYSKAFTSLIGVMLSAQSQDKRTAVACRQLFALADTPEDMLKLSQEEIVFITNRGFKALDHGLAHYDYLVVCDLLVYQDFHSELCKADQGTRIYPYWFKNLPEYQKESFLSFQYHVRPGRTYGVKAGGVRVVDKWPKSWEEGWGKAGNAVLNASMIAYFMGFTEIYLLGVEMVYRKGDTHFYKDTSKREDNVPDGHRSKGIDMLEFYAKKFKRSGVKFVNLSKGFPWKDRMLCDDLRNVITGGNGRAI